MTQVVVERVIEIVKDAGEEAFSTREAWAEDTCRSFSTVSTISATSTISPASSSCRRSRCVSDFCLAIASYMRSYLDWTVDSIYDLDLALYFNDAGERLPDARTWRFYAAPGELRLRRGVILNTRLGKWFHCSTWRGPFVVGLCWVAYLALKFSDADTSRIEVERETGTGLQTYETRVRGPFSTCAFMLFQFLSAFVLFHYTNKDLFKRQAKAFDTVVIMAGGCFGLALYVLIEHSLFQYGQWDLAAMAIQQASHAPNLLWFATLDSVRMQNKWKVFLLMFGMGYCGVEYLTIELGRGSMPAMDTCAVNLKCDFLLRTYQNQLVTVALFLLKAASAYWSGNMFAVVRPRFVDIIEGTGRWDVVRSSTVDLDCSTLKDLDCRTMYPHLAASMAKSMDSFAFGTASPSLRAKVAETTNHHSPNAAVLTRIAEAWAQESKASLATTADAPLEQSWSTKRQRLKPPEIQTALPHTNTETPASSATATPSAATASGRPSPIPSPNGSNMRQRFSMHGHHLQACDARCRCPSCCSCRPAAAAATTHRNWSPTSSVTEVTLQEGGSADNCNMCTILQALEAAFALCLERQCSPKTLIEVAARVVELNRQRHAAASPSVREQLWRSVFAPAKPPPVQVESERWI